MFTRNQNTAQFFRRMTSRPAAALVVALIIIGATASGLVKLVKDTSVKAFIPVGHPSLVADDKAREIFGLSDSVAVALVTLDGSNIFELATLELIADISAQIEALPNIRPGRVASLATESSIQGDDGAVLVDPYVTPGMDATDAADSFERWQQMQPHRGTLVSNDARSAAIIAELIDTDAAAQTYESILSIVASATTSDIEFHVAGPGAVSGFLSSYIDQDARKLQPLVFVLVLGFIFFAFRRMSALPGPLFVIVGAAGGTLGVMSWGGVPYYAITNALPVIIVAISVADAIHILSTYYRYQAREPAEPVREVVIAAMTNMARPITLTTLTTIAGFAGIGAVSIMPPITAFAWFAALGVLLAWFFSIFALPNLLVLIRPGPSPAFASWADNRPSGVGKFLAHIGAFAATNFKTVLAFFLALFVVVAIGAAQLRIDRSQVDNFAADEPIRIADTFVNDNFAGSAFLDVLIDAGTPDGLLDAARMQKIAELQSYFESLPHVQKTIGITDYLSILHNVIEGESAPSASRSLPDSDDGVAQYLLVYEASGDPTDFEEEIDNTYQYALVRGVLNEPHFSRNSETVEALERYVRNQFNEPGMTATLTGDVTVSYHWMSSLQRSHFQGVALSLALVLVTSIVVFRSVGAGIVSVIPVSFAVAVLYAFMGYTDIYLEPATSMFAAIALGVGVDFAIHLVDRIREALRIHDEDIDAAIDHALPPTARACYYNSAALAIGFSVLLASDLPTLQRFGGLVAIAAVSSYVAALIIVPALFAAGRTVHRRAFMPASPNRIRVGLFAMILAAAIVFSETAEAASITAGEVAANVANRAEGAATHRVIDMTLSDHRGKQRVRRALVLKRNVSGARHTRITYLSPKSVRNVSFLSHDFDETNRGDDRWLYIPAARKVRRIPASDRGDYFLGTDFTYEDVQSELKFELGDYSFSYGGRREVDGRIQHTLSGTPGSETISRQLGYGAFVAVIDESTWMPVHVEFMDSRMQLLKTITVHDFELIDDVWTATDIEAVNHQTGHRTRFVFRDISYPDRLPDTLFDPQALTRGLPASIGD